MQQGIVDTTVALTSPRRGFHEKWGAEIQGFGDSFVGAVLFFDQQGYLLVIEQDGVWDIPMYPVNTRNPIPSCIPWTVAHHVLGVDPKAVFPQSLVCECVREDKLIVVVKAFLPRRVVVANCNYHWVRCDVNLEVPTGVMSPLLAHMLAHSQSHGPGSLGTMTQRTLIQ